MRQNREFRYLIVVILATFVVFISNNAFGAGELDPSFNSSAYGTDSGTINAVAKQADGKIIIGGYFSEANGVATTSIARLNIDGSIDSSFNTQNLFNSIGINSSVSSLAIQPNGKILVGGYFYSSAGVPQPGLRRLNVDGSLDASFVTYTLFGGGIVDIALQPDGKIIIGGEFTGPGSSQNIARLNSDGTVNTVASGVAAIRDLELQADGKVIFGTGNLSSGTIVRLTSSLTADSTFPTITTNGSVEAVKVKPDGQILVGGSFTMVNGFSQGRISLVNSDGSLDLSFNQNNPGVSGNFSVSVYDIEIRSNGKIVLGGRFLTYNGISRKCLAQLNSDGSIDLNFQDNPVLVVASTVFDLEIQSDDNVVVGVNFGERPVTVRRFNSAGTIDAGYNPFFTRAGRVRKILQQADGKIIIGGEFPYVNGIKRNGLARLNADGSVDTTFVPAFNNEVNQKIITAVAVQPDGKILYGAQSVDQVFRLNTDGSLDTTFNTPFFGSANDISALANGQILIGGSYGIKRLNSSGTNDSTFSVSVSLVNKILVQSDGKIWIGGAFTQVTGIVRGRIARLNSDGSLDTTFNPPGGANGAVEDFDIQSDGKVVLGGQFTALNGANHSKIGRLFGDGTRDTSFTQSADGTVRAVKVQPDGKILIGGSMGFVQSESHVGLARLNSSGAIDNSFVTRPNTTVYDVLLQGDNKVLIGGEFILVNDVSTVRIARLLNASAPVRTLFDFDGDGRADVSVFRASTNRWYGLLSSNSTVTEQEFGVAGDVVAPADYDGDGKTDIAIFRPSAGDWWYKSSINGAQVNVHWGASGDVPRPGDFDGDGKADFVVYRPSNGVWYRTGSTGQVSIAAFGASGDKPVLGDFDGDGKSDMAIFRPSTGDWWYQSSINNAQIATRWGTSTDIPTPADFDGDGKTDLAVYRPSTGAWYILNSGNGSFTILSFGLAEDKPVAADYDGDGKADIAVFRPSTGVWYLLRSTSGFTALQFGVSTDIPTQNAFVP